MLRLREVNLVVICDEETLAESRRTADLMTQAHPARLIFIVVDPPDGRMPARDAPSGTLGRSSASIATACLFDETSGHHVCSEEVVIRGVHGEGGTLAGGRAPAPGARRAGGGMVGGRARRSSPGTPLAGGHRGPGGRRPQALSRSARGAGDAQGSDTGRRRDRIQELEWLRSAHWRALTAELFEQPENRSLIPLMTHLEVEHEDAPLQALLYGAWFASRLGLGPGERGWWVEGGSLCVDFVARRSGGRAFARDPCRRHAGACRVARSLGHADCARRRAVGTSREV